MGELAVGAVHLGPVLEHGQDLLDLLRQQPVDRRPTGLGIGEAAGPRRRRHRLARRSGSSSTRQAAHRRASLERTVDQLQQGQLRGRVDAVRDLAT